RVRMGVRDSRSGHQRRASCHASPGHGEELGHPRLGHRRHCRVHSAWPYHAGRRPTRRVMPLPLEVFPPLEPTLGAPPWDPLSPLEPVTPPSTCEIVIVGAGITGLASAIACATAGRHVVVLERAFGTGATARSGGVVLGETLEGPHPDFNGCEDTLRRWIDESGSDCDLRWQGCLALAHDQQLPSQPIDWHDGCSVRLVRRVEGGVLNPVKFQNALVGSARVAGVTIVDGAGVTEITQSGSTISVSTSRGTMRARAG